MLACWHAAGMLACWHAGMLACWHADISVLPRRLWNSRACSAWSGRTSFVWGSPPSRQNSGRHACCGHASMPATPGTHCYYPRHIGATPGTFPISLRTTFRPFCAASLARARCPLGVRAPGCPGQPPGLPACKSAGPGSKMPCHGNFSRSVRSPQNCCGNAPEAESLLGKPSC